MLDVGRDNVARQSATMTVLERFVTALNQQDLELLLSCFHPDYKSDQPAHPERSFYGRDRVAENWSWVFDQFDEFNAEILNLISGNDEVWTEWRWVGIDAEDNVIEVRGVMIFEIDDDLFRYGRLYMEPVDAG
jgi:hypothetical protein